MGVFSDRGAEHVGHGMHRDIPHMDAEGVAKEIFKTSVAEGHPEECEVEERKRERCEGRSVAEVPPHIGGCNAPNCF